MREDRQREAVSRSSAERHGNPHITKDHAKVAVAGGLLIAVGLLQVGLAVFSIALPEGLAWRAAVALGGVLSVGLGVSTLRNVYGAAVAGVALHALGLLLTVSMGEVFGIGIHAVMLVVVGAGALALREINRRVDGGAVSGPLTAYYHQLVALLVRAMAADGQLDRRERQKIQQVCDAMQISRYEQQRLIEGAARATAFDVRASARSYLAEARRLGVSTPEQELIVVALAVAGADGEIAAPERELIVQMALALDVSAADVDLQAALHGAELTDLDEVGARKLLGVDGTASKSDVEAAYQRRLVGLDASGYAHLGERLGRYVAGRAAVLHRARELALR